MRNALKLSLAILLVTVFACSSDDTPPVIPTVSFEFDRPIVEPGDDVTFTSTNTDADTFLWEFGDGNTSTEENPVYAYTTTGSFTITLTVTSTTGDTGISTSAITVGKRFVRAFLITSINHTDASGKPWDDDGSGPELYFGFKPSNVENLTIYDRGTDVTANDLPTGGTLPPEAQVELTNEDWDFLFLDDDDPLGAFTAEELMAAITANPATTPADEKDYDAGQGIFTLTVAEFVVQILYDIKN
ncbi:MAG: PKD domain-containing protein [Roseivirga sp.]|nr:PKD domain-containing protein [Roseivirga sp.]